MMLFFPFENLSTKIGKDNLLFFCSSGTTYFMIMNLECLDTLEMSMLKSYGVWV